MPRIETRFLVAILGRGRWDRGEVPGMALQASRINRPREIGSAICVAGLLTHSPSGVQYETGS